MPKSIKKGLLAMLVLSLVLGLFAAPTAMAAEEAAPEEEFSPYVFTFGPGADLVPDYYEFYAKPMVYNSPHYVQPHGTDREDCTFLFNIVNMPQLIEDQSQAPEGGYASVTGYCSDLLTPANHGSSYRRLNLEDGYFCHVDGEIDYTPARKVRAVMNGTFPVIDDPAEMTARVNAYLTEVHGENAVLVENLTGAEWLAASQSAVWHFTNGADFSDPRPYSHTEDWDSWGEFFCDYYFYPMMMYLDGFVNIHEKQAETTASNISGVYQYLISLPGMDPEDVVITENALSLQSAIRTDSETIFLVALNGTVDEDDELVLHATYGGVTQDIPLTAQLSLLRSRNSGLYAVSFPARTRSTDNEVQLWLDGSQSVSDICFLEAKPVEGSTARETSQSMAIHSTGAAPVRCSASTAVPETKVLSITKVDAVTQQPLPGVAFDLYMEGEEDILLGTYLTDASGVISVEVTDGSFYFKESAALPGYVLTEDTFTEGQVVNQRSTGSLSVTKKLFNASEAQADEIFHFRLTLDPSTADLMENELSWLTVDLFTSGITADKELQWGLTDQQQPTATFTLTADESITIDGIPVGTGYTLEEILTEEDRGLYTVTSTITIGDAEPITGDGTVTGTLAEDNAVIFNNTVIPSEPEPEPEPEPTEPTEPTEPEPTEPEPTEPEPTVPEPTEPKPTEPKPTEPKPTEPKPTEPKPTEPATPTTGDISMAAPTLLVVLCLITVTILLTFKRRFLTK